MTLQPKNLTQLKIWLFLVSKYSFECIDSQLHHGAKRQEVFPKDVTWVNRKFFFDETTWFDSVEFNWSSFCLNALLAIKNELT